jgi:hypothetical protein
MKTFFSLRYNIFCAHSLDNLHALCTVTGEGSYLLSNSYDTRFSSCHLPLEPFWSFVDSLTLSHHIVTMSMLLRTLSTYETSGHQEKER